MSAHAQFAKPAADEMAMTSVAGHPGIPAVVLFHEEMTNDDLGSTTTYERIKVLTDEGKKYANVELNFENFGDSKNVESIVGRTIHADGTIIPFTGKPYLKLVAKQGGYSVQARVFTLPDVQVGSILEYKYATRTDYFFEPPQWIVQGDLLVKSAHYTWYPTARDIFGLGSLTGTSAFPILPPDAKFDHKDIPAPNKDSGNQRVYELTVADVPPLTHEEYMPPVKSYSYRVLFSYAQYRTPNEFWMEQGKVWFKKQNSFMTANAALTDLTAKITAGATSPSEKLQKIYAAVQQLENTDFTRAHDTQEDKASGEGKISTAADVYSHERGTSQQLSELFVAMARAAGLKAYLALVPDRSEELFIPEWMTFRQFDGYVAIVNVEGKEMFFDPGERYCSFGHLAWEHTLVQGLRQTESGVEFLHTPSDSYSVNKTGRIADIKLDAQGGVSGTIELTFAGAPALHLRQLALRGDEESTRRHLRDMLQAVVPKTLEVKVGSIAGLTDYEKPLVVHCAVSGGLGASAGKRTVVPVDLFEANVPAAFPHEKRELAVYFQYPEFVQDAVKIRVDPTLMIEAVPDAGKLGIPNVAAYNITVSKGADFFVSRRNYAVSDVIVPVKEYTQLRTFYSQFEAKDQDSVVLKAALSGAATASATPSGN